MRAHLAMILGAIGSLAAIGNAEAFGDQKITRAVAPGATAVIRSYHIYQLNPCRSLPPPSIDARTPALGKVSSSVVEITPSNGPCGPNFKYQALRVTYQAGPKSGTDDFTLYVHDGFRFTPIPIEIRVGSQGSAASARAASITPTKVAQTNGAARNPPTPASSHKTNGGETGKTQSISGRYANNLGNIISIENGILYFTGYWNKEKVDRKPFAIVTGDGDEFEWGVYRCSGSPIEFHCSNMRREQKVVYRRMR